MEKIMYVNVVEEAFIKKMCPSQLKQLYALMDKYTMSLVDFAYNLCLEDYTYEVEEAYNELVSAFFEATGLTLSLGYHNKYEDGYDTDEVTGAFWQIEEDVVVEYCDVERKRYTLVDS